MGAWGVETFENDSALDWVFELEGAKDLSILERALTTVTDSTEYLEADTCCDALAAAEVVAALLKSPAPHLPQEVQSFVERIQIQPPPFLVGLAKQAVQRVKSDSELKELWEEGDDPDGWIRSIDALATRLN